MAESDEKCARAFIADGRADGYSILVGDQQNVTVLEQWVSESGGGFDVIIDDGGHHFAEIKHSFDVLFHRALLPGGLYFIEDLHVSNYPYMRNGSPLPREHDLGPACMGG